MDAAREFEALPQSSSAATAGAGAGVEVKVAELAENRVGGWEEIESVMSRAKSLMDKITENAESPNPIVLHALSTIIESLDASYDADRSSTNNGSSSSHDDLGCIWNLIQKNDVFFRLISFKFLTDRRYSKSVNAATVRLIFNCSLVWMKGIQKPHIFEDDVVDNFLGWSMNEPQRNSGAHLKLENIEMIRQILDVEILHTYSVALLSVCLTFGCLRMKDALTTYGLPVMLMQYLRSGVLGEVKKTAFDAALIWKLTMPKTDIGEVYIASFDSLTQLREKACVKCLTVMGKRIESIAPLLHEKAVDISIELLRKSVKIGEGVPLSRSILYLLDVLKVVGHFAAHRKFVTLFVDRGGMQRVVDVPRNKQTFLSLSLLLFAISKFKGIMEHVCDLPSNVIERVVELALELLECRDDLSSQNAGLFISSAFSFRPFVEAFDRKDGLRKLLRHLLIVSRAMTISNKNKAQCTCIALHRYMKAHLHLFVDSISHVSKVRVSYRQLDLSNEALDVVFHKIQKDQKVGPAFARATSWHAVDEFLRLKGHITVLETCQNTYRLQDSLPHVLGVLHIVTLIPYSREIIINATVSDGRVGMAVILDAIMTPADVKPEGVEPALHLLINLVCPPQSMTGESNAAIVPHQQASAEREMLEQGYQEARKAVHANKGIKALIQLLQHRKFKSLRVLICRVFLGLARDNDIADILLKLEVAEKVSELTRDSGKQSSSGEHNTWEAELAQVTVELIAVVTNCAKASTLAANDAVRTAFNCIERAAIAAATPITYNNRELLLLMHEYLQEVGLADSAAALFEDAKLSPSAPKSTEVIQMQWPSRVSPGGFFSEKSKNTSHGKSKLKIKLKDRSQRCLSPSENAQEPPLSSTSVVPMKRKLNETAPPERRVKPNYDSTPERITLHSLVIQYLKQQHDRCSAPITTLPPLSLLHHHSCPEPKQCPDSSYNVTARIGTRDYTSLCEGFDVNRNDRKFKYSRFRLRKSFGDESKPLLTSMAFLGDSSQIATGGCSRKVKIFDYNGGSKSVAESSASHRSQLTLLQSQYKNGAQLLLSSSSDQVCLWSRSSLSNGPVHLFGRIRRARFSNCGALFGAVPMESFQRKIYLFDIETCKLNLMLKDDNTNRTGDLDDQANVHSQIHFAATKSMLLWDGALWDCRDVKPIHHFERYTDFGGGGFHPAGNEVIINSEVWDLRNYKLLRSVPSLDRTTIKFNSGGDVIYAIMRRNIDYVTSAFDARRMRNDFVSAFRTVDGMSYSDIATIPAERCVLDFATEPTDSYVGVVAMNSIIDRRSTARVYEIGRPERVGGGSAAALSSEEREVASSLLLEMHLNRNDGDRERWSDGGEEEDEDTDWEFTVDEDVHEEEEEVESDNDESESSSGDED